MIYTRQEQIDGKMHTIVYLKISYGNVLNLSYASKILICHSSCIVVYSDKGVVHYVKYDKLSLPYNSLSKFISTLKRNGIEYEYPDKGTFEAN